MRWVSCITAVMAGIWLAGAAAAQLPAVSGRQKDAPIEITADSLEVIQENRLATFSGNVEVTQGTMRLNADTMKVYYHPRQVEGTSQNAVSRIDVTGKVFLATPEETASGERGIYDVDAQTVELLGNVQLTKGENVIKGDQLIYNLATGKSRISSEADASGKKQRVRGVFIPEKGN